MATTPKASRDADVVIVGGGLAGLHAASRVASYGLEPLVIEAHSRVGGRTLSRTIGDRRVDLGAEWLGRRHIRLAALARRFGLELEPARQLGHPVLWRLPCRQTIGRLPPSAVWADLARALWKARKLAGGIDPVSPWRSPRAAALDAVSVGAWLDRIEVGAEARSLLAALIGALSSSPVERVSLLQLLWWIRRGGGPLSVLRTTFQWRFKNGAQAVSENLASSLATLPIVGETVTAIEQDGGVRIETDSGRAYRASRAIVTATTSAVPSIEFVPPLPAPLRRLQELRTDPGTKVIALLPPNREPTQRLTIGKRCLWTAWRAGRRVTGFSPPPESELPAAQLAADLAGCFGVSAGELDSTVIHKWSGQGPIPGCDVAFAPSQLTEHGPYLRDAHGLVGFAGVERSSWPNSMEGALESGERAAIEAATTLAR